METLIIQGLIQEKDYGENSYALCIGDHSEPLASFLEGTITNKWVTVRYYISETAKQKEELIENSIKLISGAVDNVDYSDAYSEYTGYLWTDEDLEIRGHDLMDELRDNTGKYLYMEMDVYDKESDLPLIK